MTFRAAFIAGPTASGKSAAALNVAEALGGEIVNADAMQVYADLNVLTARPPAEDLARAPHHLYGVLDGDERCSAGRWARMAAAVIADIQGRGRLPVIVGGTGLYFRALAEGLSPVPEAPLEVRAAAKERLAHLGREAFYAEVIAQDPEMARLHINDTQRLLRAWEVYEVAGAPLSAYQSMPPEPLLTGAIFKIVLEPHRDALYANCNKRFDAMLENGALEEVRALAARELEGDKPVMKSLGAPELMAVLKGERTLEAAAAAAKMATRRFAKRQMTWFRGQAGDWARASASDAAADAVISAVKTGSA